MMCTGNPLHRAGVQSSQTRVPERSKVYGILDGRRWSVSSRNQRNSTDRCSSRQQSQQSRTIVIQIVWTTNGQPPALKINQENVRWEDLETRLAEIYLKRAEKVAFVRGDADVDFQYVADVIDVAHHAVVEWIGLLTEQPESGGE